MSDQEVNKELANLEPNVVIDLYTVDLSTMNVDDSVFRFHTMNPLIDPSYHPTPFFVDGSVAFGGNFYYVFPVSADGFDYNARGSLPRPRLIVSHLAYLSPLKALVTTYDDLVGAKVTRTRTFIKYLDSIVSDTSHIDYNPKQNPNFTISTDVFYINRKVSESKDVIEWELASILELKQVYLPNRQVIQNACMWRYRGDGCNFGGTYPVATVNNEAIGSGIDRGAYSAASGYSVGDYAYLSINDNQNNPIHYYYFCRQSSTGNKPPNSTYWIADQCSKSLSGCKLRFGAAGELAYGGFPGVNRMPQ